ncbi:MAG: 1-acylglycerol-3-phosphate O-acyltransferase [Peltula sp. TS41687]|nr:MAG: 1-acylglycerol-3-phosphate O-acyltransferase [Peltula sp. TS41687]
MIPNLPLPLPLYLLLPLLYILLTILSTYILSPLGLFPSLAFYARIIIAHIALLACAFYGVFASIVLRLLGYGQVSQWAAGRAFKWLMWWSTGVRFVVVQGREHLGARPAVFVGNHQTELDVLCLGTIIPPYCSVTAKKSLKRVPILGWFMALSKTVFIDRANRQTAVAAFDGAAAEMRRDRDKKKKKMMAIRPQKQPERLTIFEHPQQSVYIFAEGTRSYFAEPDLLPFKKGAFHLAVQAQVPIVPVVVASYTHILDLKRRRFGKGDIPICVLPPIPTSDLTSADVEDLARDTREGMLVELRRLTERARLDFGGGGSGKGGLDGRSSSAEKSGVPNGGGGGGHGHGLVADL